MENQPNKRLSDVTREASTKKTNKFADSLMPAMPKQKPERTTQESAPIIAVTPEPTSAPVAQAVIEPSPTVATPTSVKAERPRKSGGVTVDDIINGSAKEGDVFNKMVRVTDDHHELLRLMAFKYRKPMNVIVHNLIALLDQAYQKEQKGGQIDV
jgi:hypothetical protein